MKYLLLALMALGCSTTIPVVPVIPGVVTPVFGDGTIVIEQWMKGGYYFREGHDEKGDCRLSRTPVEKDGDFMFMRLNGTTETCSGTTCTHCAFKKSGGCECKNIAQGICTHTISRNRDLIRLRLATNEPDEECIDGILYGEDGEQIGICVPQKSTTID